MDKRRQRIRTLMDKIGYSYRDLEAQTGIPSSVLQRYVTGKTNKMSIDYFELIAKALDVSPGKLMGWENEISEKSIEVYEQQKPTNRYKHIIDALDTMNDEGVEKVEQYADDIASNDKYKKRG